MVFRSIRLAMLAALSALMLSACVPAFLLNVSVEQDRFAKAFSPPDDKALIYLYLDEQTADIAETVVIDGRIAGVLRPSLYLMSKVAPGQHRFALGDSGADGISLDIDGGKAYFITAHAACEYGKSHAQLQLVDEATGRQHILRFRLANVTLFGRPLLNDKPTSACGPSSRAT